MLVDDDRERSERCSLARATINPRTRAGSTACRRRAVCAPDGVAGPGRGGPYPRFPQHRRTSRRARAAQGLIPRHGARLRAKTHPEHTRIQKMAKPMKTNATKIPNRNKNANMRLILPPCQFAATACIFARPTHRTASETRCNSQPRNNLAQPAQPGFLFGPDDSLGYTSSPVLGMLARSGGFITAPRQPSAMVLHS